MIDITCKCICCGKQWTIKIDEEDARRYVSGIEKERPSACNCQGPLVKEYDIPVIDTVCEECSEEI